MNTNRVDHVRDFRFALDSLASFHECHCGKAVQGLRWLQQRPQHHGARLTGLPTQSSTFDVRADLLFAIRKKYVLLIDDYALHNYHQTPRNSSMTFNLRGDLTIVFVWILFIGCIFSFLKSRSQIARHNHKRIVKPRSDKE
jgi:hypothetical protein